MRSNMCRLYHLLALVTCIALVATQEEIEEQLLEATTSSSDAPSSEGTPASFNPNVRIVGGEIAWDRSQFPYQASLRQRSFRGSFHFCGATIIDEQHLLTAAHCLVSDTGVITSPSRIFAVVGDLSVAQQTQFTVPKAISNIFTHPHYSTTTFQHDVAVVRVNAVFTLTCDDFVEAPVCIISQFKITDFQISKPFGNWTAFINYLPLAIETPRANTICTVSGWGLTEVNGRPSDVLRYVNVPIVLMSVCRSRYGNGILPGMICAGFMEGGRDACQGDSGGPLACHNTVAGIVSWGYSCAAPGFPGVYADVSEYRLWIEEQTYRSSSGRYTINACVSFFVTFAVLERILS